MFKSNRAQLFGESFIMTLKYESGELIGLNCAARSLQRSISFFYGVFISIDDIKNKVVAETNLTSFGETASCIVRISSFFDRSESFHRPICEIQNLIFKVDSRELKEIQSLKLEPTLFSRPHWLEKIKISSIYSLTSYLVRKSQSAGFDDILTHTEETLLGETSFANIFLELDGEILTSDQGIYKGDWREYLINKSLVRECEIPFDVIYSAKRIWAGNSIRGMIPVSQVGDTYFEIEQNKFQKDFQTYRDNLDIIRL